MYMSGYHNHLFQLKIQIESIRRCSTAVNYTTTPSTGIASELLKQLEQFTEIVSQKSNYGESFLVVIATIFSVQIVALVNSNFLHGEFNMNIFVKVSKRVTMSETRIFFFLLERVTRQERGNKTARISFSISP